jgi:hypothetical protein
VAGGGGEDVVAAGVQGDLHGAQQLEVVLDQ